MLYICHVMDVGYAVGPFTSYDDAFQYKIRNPKRKLVVTELVAPAHPERYGFKVDDDGDIIDPPGVQSVPAAPAPKQEPVPPSVAPTPTGTGFRNRYAGCCCQCGDHVAQGAGFTTRHDGSWKAICAPCHTGERRKAAGLQATTPKAPEAPAAKSSTMTTDDIMAKLRASFVK